MISSKITHTFKCDRCGATEDLSRIYAEKCVPIAAELPTDWVRIEWGNWDRTIYCPLHEVTFIDLKPKPFFDPNPQEKIDFDHKV